MDVLTVIHYLFTSHLTDQYLSPHTIGEISCQNQTRASRETLRQDRTQDCSAQWDSIETTPLNGLSSIHWLDFHLVTCVSYNIHTKTKELFIVNKCLNYNIVMREGRESNGFLFDWKGQGGWFFLHFRRRNIWTFWDVGETAGLVAGR